MCSYSYVFWEHIIMCSYSYVFWEHIIMCSCSVIFRPDGIPDAILYYVFHVLLSLNVCPVVKK